MTFVLTMEDGTKYAYDTLDDVPNKWIAICTDNTVHLIKSSEFVKESSVEELNLVAVAGVVDLATYYHFIEAVDGYVPTYSGQTDTVIKYAMRFR